MATVAGMFDSREQAEQAVARLRDAGYRPDDISIVMRDKEDAQAMQAATGVGSATTTGIVSGGVLGGLAGLLVGLGALAIPGIGPIVAAGPLVAALTGGAIGATAGGLVGALVSAGVPEEEARFYHEGVERGGILLTVHVPDGQESAAQEVLQASGMRDIRQDAHAWAWNPAWRYGHSSMAGSAGNETGGGAVAGGATGAVVGGIVGGPVGAVVGGLIGGTAGAATGAVVGTGRNKDAGDQADEAGTGGAIAGGTTGALIGTAVAGPLGTAVGGLAGGAVGAISGAAAGASKSESDQDATTKDTGAANTAAGDTGDAGVNVAAAGVAGAGVGMAGAGAAGTYTGTGTDTTSGQALGPGLAGFALANPDRDSDRGARNTETADRTAGAGSFTGSESDLSNSETGNIQMGTGPRLNPAGTASEEDTVENIDKTDRGSTGTTR